MLLLSRSRSQLSFSLSLSNSPRLVSLSISICYFTSLLFSSLLFSSLLFSSLLFSSLLFLGYFLCLSIFFQQTNKKTRMTCHLEIIKCGLRIDQRTRIRWQRSEEH